jgi:sec-independent protein translocase protein TatA
MPNLGFQELLVIGGILVLLFGATKLPALGKGLGEAMKNFKSGLKESKEAEPKAELPDR